MRKTIVDNDILSGRYSAEEIAARHAVGPCLVKNRARTLGKVLPRQECWHVDARRLFAEGKSEMAIAVVLGKSYALVSKLLSGTRVKREPRGTTPNAPRNTTPPKTPRWYGEKLDFGPLVPSTYHVVVGGKTVGTKQVGGTIVLTTTEPYLAWQVTGMRPNAVKCAADMTVLAVWRARAK